MSKEKAKAFVSYLDDNDQIVNGYFEIVDRKDGYLIIKSGKNKISIPNHRVKKIKEDLE